MTIVDCQLRPIDDPEAPRAVGRVQSIHLRVLYFAWSGRNAYHWTWVSEYAGDRAFYSTFEESAANVERRRVQGSTWWIGQIPAIVLRSRRCGLVLTEINSNRPFAALQRVPILVTRLENVVEVVRSFGPDLKAFVCDHDCLERFSGPPRLFKSKSWGGGYYLGWDEIDGEIKLPIARALVRRWQNRLRAHQRRKTGR